MWYFKVNSWNACQNQTFGLERLPNDEFWFGSQVNILIVIHEALTLLFLPVSCHHTRPRSARTHLAALAGAKNVALDADLPCVFLGGGRVVQVQNCSVVVRTLVTNELDERTSVTGIVWWSNTRYKRLFGRWLQTYFGKETLVTNVHGCWNVVYRRLFPPNISWRRLFCQKNRHKLKA